MRSAIGVLALGLILSGCGDGGGEEANLAAANTVAPLPQIPAPNNGDWTQTVSLTAEGGHLMGNPDAPVKLIEYGSLTCPVCGAFSRDATAALRDTYIRSGQVSLEFRHLLVHGAPDVVLSLLSNCLTPSAFFPTIEQVYAQQSEIVARLDQTEVQRIQALPQDQQLPAVARAMELDSFFARRGLPESRFNQCVGDMPAAQRLADSTGEALNQQNIRGTPTFIINGEQQDVTSWNALEPRLRAALGR